MASAPFSSPPAHPVSHTVNGAYADDCTFWATAALANDAKDSSPLVALNSICQVRANLTMSSERLTRSAGIALATAGRFDGLLDVEDAKATLKFVAVKEGTRASKRKAEAQLAALGAAGGRAQ